jgi:outer membrane receptor protein involved in Fe transport
MRLKSLCHVILTAALLLCAGSAFAQSGASGNIEGIVTDSTGGVLPGVTVTIRNMATNVTRETVTESNGRYRAAALQPGKYEVTASLSGFQAQPVSNIEVQIGQTAPVDVKMHAAGVAETVMVTAEAPVIDTRRTDVSNVVSEVAMENLPVTGRRWDNFVLLSPGVTNDGNFGLVSYRGISGLYNNNMVDGVDNNQAFFSEARGRTRIAYSISESSIKEFQVGVSNMSAEFGRSAGGTVNAVTKSGGNTFSGEGFYFLRDKAFQARNPKITLPDPTAKPDERRQQFGAAVGGPIKKDKVFFFGDYDQQVRNFPIFAVPNSPTFLPDPNNPLAGACTAPAANCASAVAFFQSVNILTPRTGDNKVGLGKVDINLNANNNLSLQLNSHRWNSDNGIQTQPTVNLAANMNGTDIVKTDFFVGSLNTVISARALNELKVQVGRDYEEQQPNGVPPATTVTGGIAFGMPNFLPRAAYPHEQRYEFMDAYTYYTGGHSLKFGADINFVKEQLINLFNGGGTFAYSNLTAIANDCPIGAVGCTPAATGTTTGRHYNTFSQAFDLTGLNGKLNFNEWQHSFYAQDTWRVNNELLVNLGLRYDYQALPEPGSVTTDGYTFNGNPQYPLTTHFNQDKNNFGPRLGFTYDFGGKHDTVVRASWGTFYGLTSNSAVASALTINAVSQQSFTFTPTTAGAPAYPATFSTVPTITGVKPNLNVLGANLQRPTIQMFDLTVDRRIMNDVTVSVSYLYSHGANLPIFRDTNFSPANSQVAYVVDGATVGTFPLYRGTRPDANVGTVFTLDSSVTSRYNALVLQTTKQFSKGLMFNANYTLSKSEDNGQESTTFFPTSFPETYDPFSTTGPDGVAPSSFDRRHRFVGSAYYRPDYLWGIGLSTVVTVESGLPISENISGSLSAAVGAVSTGSTNGTNGGIFAPWLGRNSDRQPGRKTVDLRASKEFNLGGGKKAEVLWEVFNLFNWINYTGASATAFGITSSTYDPGANLATVTLNHNTGFLGATTIGNTLYGMRDMQLGLKFRW